MVVMKIVRGRDKVYLHSWNDHLRYRCLATVMIVSVVVWMGRHCLEYIRDELMGGRGKFERLRMLSRLVVSEDKADIRKPPGWQLAEIVSG